MRSEGDYEERHVDAAAVDMELRELQSELVPQERPTSVGDWVATGGDHGNHVRADFAPEQDMLGDEVDSGVGGATAHAIGQRLWRLADRTQLLVVTHSPQVAARGADHLLVQKAGSGDRMITDVKRLGSESRLEEVARMLSGATLTAEARAAAGR